MWSISNSLPFKAVRAFLLFFKSKFGVQSIIISSISILLYRKTIFGGGDGTESVCLSCNWCYPTEKEASNEISVITATRPRNGEFSYRIHAERMRVVAGRGGEKINLLQPLIAGNQSGAVTVSTPLTVNLGRYHCFAVKKSLLDWFYCPEEESETLIMPISQAGRVHGTWLQTGNKTDF